MILVLCALALLGGGEPRPFPADVDARFTSSRASQHIEVLAADSMKGRDTPSRELELSAEYIAQRFRQFGLEPIGGSYFHRYNLERVDLQLPCTLTLQRGDRTLRAEIKADFMPFEETGEGTISNAPVVFAGFGITAPEYAYDDYASIDAKGAVVLILRGEPDNADTTKFRGRQFTWYGSLRSKIENARKHGAVGIMVIDALRTPRKPFVTGFPWASVSKNAKRDTRPLQLPDTTRSLPCVHVGEQIATFLLDSLDAVRSLTLQLDSTITPASRMIDGVRMSCSVTLAREKVPVRNVHARLRGASVPHEYAVMGAHYDHIGVGKLNDSPDTVYNGADDNASGTTGLLMAAEALATSSQRPERSVVFVAFSGEEKGLYGSRAYVDSSPLPLDSCVAMVNMDMIGRCENNKLSIGGNERCPDMIAINEQENAALGRPMTLAYDIERYFFRSDQASFARRRIPVIFFFTGEHADYHKHSDHIEKINLDDLSNIARLATRVTWRVTQQPRTRYVPGGFER